MFVLVAVLAAHAARNAETDGQAIQQDALNQGYWVARSLEIGHRRMRRDDEGDPMRDLVDEIVRNGVDSLLVVKDDGTVLLSSDATLQGTRIAGITAEPVGRGRVLRSDSRRTELAYPVHFAQAMGAMPGMGGMRGTSDMPMHRDAVFDSAKWVVVTLDTSEAYARYKSGTTLSLLVLLLTAGLGLGAFIALGVLQDYQKLAQIRRALQRFVPRTVQELIEDNPEHPMFDKVERNATVLFLDIERYTRLSEDMSGEVLNHLVEKYFSAFLDIILSHGGEINETAGDGIMAIFTGQTPRAHALSAVAAAVAIRAEASVLNRTKAPHEPEIQVNVGINTGEVLIGATAIKGETGERLTYTASGTPTNIAARLCDLGDNGEICLTAATAELVRDQIALSGPRQTHLKNVSQPIAVFRVK